jgi:hypothetical protein
MMTPLSTKIKQNTLSFGLIGHKANAVVMAFALAHASGFRYLGQNR